MAKDMMTTTDATGAVAKFISSTRYEDIPEAVLDRAAKHVADTIGVILAGLNSDLAPPLRKYIKASGASGASRVVGWGDATSPEVAALANGALAHALDYDDANTAMRGHPSAIAVGALLASPEAAGMTGKQLLEAYTIGVECATRISRAMGLGPHNNPGWHITATMGVFASTAAMAKIRGLDEHQIRMALGVVASMSSGIQRNFGTMTKPLHAGIAARSGLTAVTLAQSGWTAYESVFDGPVAFPAVFGTGDADVTMIEGSLGKPFVFAEPQFGMNLKLYPCCYGNARPIEAIEKMFGGKKVDPSTIEKIELWTLPNGLRPLLYSRPTTGLEGKFSGEYNIAAAIVDAQVNFATFTDEMVNRPEIQALIERTTQHEHERCNVGENGEILPNTFGIGTRGFIELIVTMKDGRVLTEKVYASKGSAVRPLDWADVEAKFLDCAKEGSIDAGAAKKVISSLQSLSSVSDMRALVDTLAPR